MIGYTILFALCVAGAHAIGGGVTPAPNTAPHACMILVHRQNLDGTNTAALGGGSIISNRHVLTAAHLVQGVNINYQIGFIVNGARRLLTSTFRLIHEDYLNTDFSNDIALIFLQGTSTFPLANAIPITAEAAAPSTDMLTVGFGFTDATSTGASSDPYQADQQIADPCEFDNFNLTDTHFCAQDGAEVTFICPGDNGAGAFIPAADADSANELVGIVSRVVPGCSAAQPTGYTIVGLYIDWITNVTGTSVSQFISNYNKKHHV